MSRNNVVNSGQVFFNVAPRKGRVSRNAVQSSVSDQFFVAPRKGRVSRNVVNMVLNPLAHMSRPARGV